MIYFLKERARSPSEKINELVGNTDHTVGGVLGVEVEGACDDPATGAAADYDDYGYSSTNRLF